VGREITPLRNEIPREKSTRGDTAHRWKQINGINTNVMPPGVSEGNRSGVIATTESDRSRSMPVSVRRTTSPKRRATPSEGFDDVLALASENLLKALMISEERMIFGGNSSVSRHHADADGAGARPVVRSRMARTTSDASR
jgi:hypothetical protein